MWGGRTRRTIPLALKPARRRALVDTIKSDWKVSVRRACSVLKIDRSLYVYKSKRGEQAELKLRIKDICQTRVRYGYRSHGCECESFLHFLLTCKGQYAPARKGRGVAFDLPSCWAELTSNLEPPLFGVFACTESHPGRGGFPLSQNRD